MAYEKVVSTEIARFVNAEDKYVCALDAKSIAKAQKELNENPKERRAIVDQLRKWIIEQPHFKFPTDTLVLLMFLRRSAFSQLEARALIENYVAVCCTKLTFLAKDIDLHSSGLNAALEIGIVTPLPVPDDEGRRIIIIRPGGIKADQGYKNHDVFKMFHAIMTYFVQLDEATQVNGIVVMDDQTNITPKTLAFSGLDNLIKFFSFFMNKYPVRMKGWHFYNAAAVAQTLMSAIMPFLPQKIRERMFLHGNNMEDVYKHIPMRLLPSEYLPDDYTGPCQGSLFKIQASYKEALQNKAVRDKIWNITSSGMMYNESKKPGDLGPQASFRKLNLD
ncbi:unnamed protein product [Owenia fusiformis]|uniref:CRAL-TRIO domain-containing protein n=1 Tax=Owenia fusiformis TaxID=6347 RepID=A0A8S4NBG1_OWEFU|nr:unnamed protein product [Owenia fusiformis]